MGMNSKLNIIFLLLAIFGVAVFSQKLNAENILQDKTINIQGLVLSAIPECKLSDKIKEAKQLLENSPPLQFKEVLKKDKKGRIIKKKGQPVLELTEKEISLAILDTETCQVLEKRYWLNITEINKASNLRKKYLSNPDNLPVFRSDNPNEEFHVINNWWNSFNSDWSIAKKGVVSSWFSVVADKYLMSNEDLAYPEDRTGEKYSDIIYVPYSGALKNKTLIALGKQFLNDHVKEAFNQLIVARVMSASFQGRPVTDTITQKFVKNIFLTEQTDPKMMLLSNDGGLELAERVLIRLGTNNEKAFRYTVSKTGASGLGQIMPGTYNSIVRRYPTAKLIQNTDIGRVDITNAIKVSVLVFDDHLSTVIGRVNSSSKARQIFSKKSENEIDEIRAAIYNGGPGKYKYLTGNISTAVTETVLFVRKFRMIRELNLFD